MGYGHYGMGGFGAVGMILFWILTVLAIVWLLRALDVGRTVPWRADETRHDERRPESRSGSGRDDRAIAILRERYASGAVDADEFERRKRDLLRKDEA